MSQCFPPKEVRVSDVYLRQVSVVQSVFLPRYISFHVLTIQPRIDITMKRSLILALFLATEFASGFQAIQSNSAFVTKKQFKNAALFMSPEKESFDPVGLASETISEDRSSKTALLSAAGLISSGLLSPSISNAAGPDWGIFEGRTGSLLHPAMMAGMLLLSVSTGLKGFQYRRLRTIGGEITEMKKGLPKFEGKSLSEAIRNMEAMEEVDVAAVSKLKAALPLEKEINDLVVERKGLSSLAPRDSHFSQGATLAFLGTAFAIEVSTSFSYALVF